MKLTRSQLLKVVGVIYAILSLAPMAAHGQAYPSRPVRMIVPYPPGGPTDAAGRVMAERMRVSLGQPLIVENVAGANGSIGIGRLAQASADGYTFGLGPWNTHVSNAALYALPYDVRTDFEPVAAFVKFSFVIAANKALPANNLRELIAWLRTNPNKASQGSAGVGSMGHIAGALLQKLSGTRFQHVPYRGSAPAMQDLVAGQIDIVIDAPVVVLPQIQASKVRGLAVAAKSRLAIAPDLPTTDEAGLLGFYVSNWFAFWVPKGTPKAVIDVLNAAVVDTLADPASVKRLADIGFEIVPRDQETPEALAALQSSEIDKWWPIIKAANIKGE